MSDATQVLTAEYDMTDEPLPVDDIDGLRAAVDRIAEAREGRELVRCEERVMDYEVYWNEKTDTIRIGAKAMLASYEIDDSTPTLEDYDD